MNGWDNLLDTLNTAVLVVGFLTVVFGIGLWWTSHQDRKTTRRKKNPGSAQQRDAFPSEWPLDSRPIVTGPEREVWHWLLEIFPECLVLPKLPVTRFTAPLSHFDAQHWFNVIGNVYCTFTLCTADGHVIGCVDVTGPRNFSRSNRQLKQSLLSQCEMAYWVVTPEALPATDVIRAEFLGDATVQSYYAVARPAPTVRSTKPNAASTPKTATRPMPLMASATAPAPLSAVEEENDFQETRNQLRETLLERRSARHYQRTAANDNLSRPAAPAKMAPPPRVMDNAAAEEDNSFFVAFDDEDERSTMLALLSKKTA